jgi:hypothetical protein
VIKQKSPVQGVEQGGEQVSDSVTAEGDQQDFESNGGIGAGSIDGAKVHQKLFSTKLLPLSTVRIRNY